RHDSLSHRPRPSFPTRRSSDLIVEHVRRVGLAGATVVRGIEGFGADSHLHTSRILRLSEDLPVVIEIVDTAENIDRILPSLDGIDRKSTRLNSSHQINSYAVFC